MTSPAAPAAPGATPQRHAAELAAACCPLCSAPALRLFCQAGFWICRCTDCAHRFADLEHRDNHVAEVYGDGYFFGGGAGYQDYLSEGDLLRSRGRYYGRLLRRYRSPGCLLDVGAAAGFILEGFLDEGWTGEGWEPNARMAARARQRGLVVREGTLESGARDKSFDLVSLIQVLAHVVDVREALGAVAALTRTDGHCLVETWNVESWTARLLGRHWHEYSPPSVLHWFSPARLRRLFAEYHFEPVAWGRPAKWIRGSHAKSLLRYKLQGNFVTRLLAKSLAVIPDRLSIPYPAVDLFWLLFRKLD